MRQTFQKGAECSIPFTRRPGDRKFVPATIPRMVCLLCLLTSLGERFAFRFLRGPAPAPPRPFEKGRRKLYVLLTFGYALLAIGSGGHGVGTPF